VIINKIKLYWEEKPFELVILTALIFRLLAAVFSKGFGMLDDHFVIIENAQGWVDGNYKWFKDGYVPFRNLVYPGLHYLWFYFSDNILGITDPQFKMLIVRIFHAFFSVLVVSLSYQITLKISNRENARLTGIILALFWPLPFLSVRNLVEVVCIPPILAGFYFLFNEQENKESIKHLMLSGIMTALSFTVRYQMAFFAAGIGMVLLAQKKWRDFLWFSIGFIITVSITTGVLDYLAWGIPFYSLINYITYNLSHQYDYVTQPWYNYILLILGIFIPIGFFLAFGYIKSWKKYAILFWPSFLFFFFHSYFANKQERFILPVIPFIVILGIVGWNEYVKSSAYWSNKTKTIKIFWNSFWIINTILLMAFTFTYGKKNRVESLYYLSKKEPISSIVWESSIDELVFAPKFYLRKHVPIFRLPSTKTLEALQKEIKKSGAGFPEYIVFLGEEKLDYRVKNFENYFHKKLTFEKKINPSLIDYIVHKLNPKNNINQTTYVYHIE
jgi:hypothetical protein